MSQYLIVVSIHILHTTDGTYTDTILIPYTDTIQLMVHTLNIQPIHFEIGKPDEISKSIYFVHYCILNMYD